MMGTTEVFRMRPLFAVLTLCFTVLSVIGCGGESKPDPRDRPDFIDTSDPGATSLYTEDDFKQGRPPGRP
jgi:hypothetical protein